MEKKEGGAFKMAAAAACRGGGVGGQHGWWHVQREACTVGGQHVLGRRQVGEWRGWVGGHTAGLGLRLAAGAGTAQQVKLLSRTFSPQQLQAGIGCPQ